MLELCASRGSAQRAHTGRHCVFLFCSSDVQCTVTISTVRIFAEQSRFLLEAFRTQPKTFSNIPTSVMACRIMRMYILSGSGLD